MPTDFRNHCDMTSTGAGRAELRLEPTVFQGLLEAVVASLRPLAAAKGLQLLITMPGEDIMAWTDRRVFSQIVLNLLKNAIQFTDRGSVHLNLGLRTLDGKKVIEVEIADTGIGIGPGDQARLFSIPSRADAAARAPEESAGPSLQLSQHLAELLGGKIGVRSEHGKGSTFTLQLPQR